MQSIQGGKQVTTSKSSAALFFLSSLSHSPQLNLETDLSKSLNPVKLQEDPLGVRLSSHHTKL